MGIGLLIAALAVVQTLLAWLQTWEHCRFARSRLRARPTNTPSGRAVVLVPCRGLDVGVEENLRRLFQQEYQDYEIWFLLENPQDVAYPLIRRLVAAHPDVSSRILFVGQAKESGQKVHNLRVATEALPDSIEYLVFVDADARPGSHWLHSLIARLSETGAGAVTGHRWFIPQRPTLANHLLYSLNCNVAMFFNRNGPNMVWGGSWAIRRSVFERLKIREAWKGTLSDDLVATRVLYQSGRHVEFEPTCVVASPLGATLPQMLAFVRRQYLIGRFYVPLAWTAGLLSIASANLAFFGSLAWSAWALATETPGAWISAAFCAILYLSSAGRSIVRSKLALRYFPQWNRSLRKAARFDLLAGPLVTLVNGLVLLASLLGRQITWRGITYRLSSGGQIERLQHDDPPASQADTFPILESRNLVGERKAA